MVPTLIGLQLPYIKNVNDFSIMFSWAYREQFELLEHELQLLWILKSRDTYWNKNLYLDINWLFISVMVVDVITDQLTGII